MFVKLFVFVLCLFLSTGSVIVVGAIDAVIIRDNQERPRIQTTVTALPSSPPPCLSGY